MNSIIPNDDDRFDRLVDGELSEAERRQLLAALDREPDGWRRCALAFLESQCWKEGLGALLGFSRPAASAALRASAAWTRSLRIFGSMAFAVAAIFLLAFGLTGYWLGGGKTVGDHSEPGSQMIAGVSDSLQPGPRFGPLAAESSPWQMVKCTPPGAGGNALLLPAIERDRWDDRLLENLPPAMPENVLQAFERTGHRVQRQRALVPMRMKDGRILLLPVEQMEIQPAQGPVY
jgi:hypothetical protein